MTDSLHPFKAYGRLRRVKDAMRFINKTAQAGPRIFEASKSNLVAQTYGIEESLVRRMKARKRSELSCGEMGK